VTVDAGSFGAAALELPKPESPAPKTIVARSAYDDLMAVVARKSQFNARLVRENADLAKALRAVAAWILAYCEAKVLGPDEVDVTWSMTRDGVIVLHIGRKEGVDY
jgi:hypothetical protein